MAESSVPGPTRFGSGISLGGAVLWDVDGTLVESTDMAFNATMSGAQTVEVAPDEDSERGVVAGLRPGQELGVGGQFQCAHFTPHNVSRGRRFPTVLTAAAGCCRGR